MNEIRDSYSSVAATLVSKLQLYIFLDQLQCKDAEEFYNRQNTRQNTRHTHAILGRTII